MFSLIVVYVFESTVTVVSQFVTMHPILRIQLGYVVVDQAFVSVGPEFLLFYH